MYSRVLCVAGLVTIGLAAAAAQTPAPAADPLSRVVQNGWNNVKRNLRESAEQMPDANYAFKPVDTVKTFGEILAHTAGANYAYCSMAKGEKTPFTEEYFEKNAKTRADIIKAVNDSIAYCDGAYGTLTDAALAQTVAVPDSTRTVPRAQALLGNIAHDNEHYGNLVTYFRLKGMVPPSTARQTR